MGDFDTFLGEANCPYCNNKKHFFYHQTKDFNCNMDSFMLGDYIGPNKINYIHKIKGLCYLKNKDFDINVLIKNGQIINFLNNNEIQKVNLKQTRNIEEGLGKKQQYLYCCNKGVGLAKERLPYTKGFPLKRGEEVTLLNNKWNVLDIFKEKFNTNNTKYNKFCKDIYKDSYVYKIDGTLGIRYVRINAFSTTVFLVNEFKPQIGCVLEKI